MGEYAPRAGIRQHGHAHLHAEGVQLALVVRKVVRYQQLAAGLERGDGALDERGRKLWSFRPTNVS